MRLLMALPLVLVLSCAGAKPPTTASATDAGDAAGSASASLRGPRRNQPPVIHFGTPRPPDPAPANTLYTLVGGQPVDPEGDDPNRLCERTRLVVSGPCRAAIAGCGGVGDVFDVDLRTQTGPGVCEVVVRVGDSRGAVGSDRLRFAVLP